MRSTRRSGFRLTQRPFQPTVAFPHLPSNTRVRLPKRDAHRPVSCYWKLHERSHRGHAPSCRRAARSEGSSQRALHRDPGHASGVPSVHEEGPDGRVPRRGTAVARLRAVRAWAVTWAFLPLASVLSPPPSHNFVGRMGDPPTSVLSSPAVAAASAVLGRIGLPEDLD